MSNRVQNKQTVHVFQAISPIHELNTYPTPGPPVMIETPKVIEVSTAFFWTGRQQDEKQIKIIRCAKRHE